MLRENMIINIAFFITLSGLLLTASCAKKAVVSELYPAGPSESKITASDTEKTKPKKNVVYKKNVINEDIYFAFDSAVLSSEAQRLLQRKAAWLRLSPEVMVIIEGHCDERGAREYNHALGQRRAESVRTYMTLQGISAVRLEAISYGEERPVDPRSNEAAWGKNRRVHFVIK